jgi:hypothetical protein
VFLRFGTYEDVALQRSCHHSDMFRPADAETVAILIARVVT